MTVDGNLNVRALVGKVIIGLYPAANYRGARPRLEVRRVLVEQVRDTETDPLDAATIELDPLLNRGRLLVTGWDLDKRAERSFYLDRMVVEQIIDNGAARVEPGANGKYQVWIVEEVDGANLADLRPSELSTDDPKEAVGWADAFNEVELHRPVNTWAVVRVTSGH